MARPSKPHHQSWDNKPVAGLYKCPDGRWRMQVDGKDVKFSEADERKAIDKFHAMQPKAGTIAIPVLNAAIDTLGEAAKKAGGQEFRITAPAHFRDPIQVTRLIDSADFWATVRDELINRPANAAKMTGIAGLAQLPFMRDTPRPQVKLAHLKDIYEKHNDSDTQSKKNAVNTFDDFLKITGAKMLDDLTPDVLKVYREKIKKRVSSPGTVAAYFGRCKFIIAFGKSEGEDAEQIDAALSRMDILKAPKDDRTHQPTPISPTCFKNLCEKAGELYPEWEPRLLLMLNLCLHFDEALDLQWDDFNLDAGTFCTHRNKTGRVVRAAVLWDRTIDALKKIKRNGSPYVFTSGHGTRFNAKGQWKTWNKLRVAAGCPDVQMDDVRDGAYSAACNAPGVEEKIARLFAGHRSHGLQDNYVQRNPGVVRPACVAVHDAYFSE